MKLLKNNPSLNLTVEGHTDNIGTPVIQQATIRGSCQVGRCCADGSRYRSAAAQGCGYGQEKPIADNSTDDGRAKNRRVELVKME